MLFAVWSKDFASANKLSMLCENKSGFRRPVRSWSLSARSRPQNDRFMNCPSPPAKPLICRMIYGPLWPRTTLLMFIFGLYCNKFLNYEPFFSLVIRHTWISCRQQQYCVLVLEITLSESQDCVHNLIMFTSKSVTTCRNLSVRKWCDSWGTKAMRNN